LAARPQATWLGIVGAAAEIVLRDHRKPCPLGGGAAWEATVVGTTPLSHPLRPASSSTPLYLPIGFHCFAQTTFEVTKFANSLTIWNRLSFIVVALFWICRPWRIAAKCFSTIHLWILRLMIHPIMTKMFCLWLHLFSMLIS
jgi:hypothetical protein